MSVAAKSGRRVRPGADTFCTSGSSPTLHLLGPGAVGRALLRQLAGGPYRVVAVTDSTATLHDASGLDSLDIVAYKQAGGRLVDRARARVLPLPDALACSGADVIVDATPTTFARPLWTRTLAHNLSRGARIAFAAKDALCEESSTWLAGAHAARVGCNAVLGGTGLRFCRELRELRTGATAVAVTGNASTTAIIQVLERGGTFAEGLADARQRGFLEPDPELDLRGVDAAVKLAIVGGALLGHVVDARRIPCQDLRSLDPAELRARAKQGLTTRLVGRATRQRELRVTYEAVPAGSPLATACGRVAYCYTLADGGQRVHEGGGLGPDATAAAVLCDLETFLADPAFTTCVAGAA
jgi:homoserine dehydrogenase